MIYKRLLFFVFLFLSLNTIQAQMVEKAEKRKKRYVLLPATAYTPETGLTIGLIGDHFFDLAYGDANTRMSKVSFAGIYTTKKQLYLLGEWLLFTPEENYIFQGQIKYSKFTDRNYGLGNNTSQLVVEYEPKANRLDTLKFVNYDFNFYGINGSFIKKIKKSFYAGLIYDFERTYNYSNQRDSVSFINDLPTNIVPFNGHRSGIGIKLTYDNRKNVNNPRKGTFLQLNNINYNSILGSDFNYSALTLDARHYINTYKDQTLAFRILWDQRFVASDQQIPLRGYATAGGKDFARGYFEGTYRDKYMVGLQTEYRVPLWLDENASFWKFWRRLGIVVFGSAVQAQGNYKDFSADQFNFAVGGGLRFMLDTQPRVNVRVDYGVGLNKEASYTGRQTGLYFYLSEAF